MRRHPFVKFTLISIILLMALASAIWAQAGWPDAPTADDMLADDTVSDAIEDAWTDSQADNQANRHEEGGWIIQCREHGDTGDIYSFQVYRVPAGDRDGIAPGNPPDVGEDCRVVGFFHTHPNPPTDENGKTWGQGPSVSDTNWHTTHGIPGIIRNAAGTETFGPVRGVYH